MSTQLREGRVEKILTYIVSKLRLTDAAYDEFMLDINKSFPELDNRKVCPNCDASMAEYIYTVDSLDCLLILGMGNIIKTRLTLGMPFTEANQVHLQKELNHYYSVPSRSTQCAKLGLIAKMKTKGGKHDRSKGWCLTKRGFEFLAGKPVPKKVRIWRRKIEEHFDETITIEEAKLVHKDLIDRKVAAGRIPKGDYRKEFDMYNANEWVEIIKYHEGKIL